LILHYLMKVDIRSFDENDESSTTTPKKQKKMLSLRRLAVGFQRSAKSMSSHASAPMQGKTTATARLPVALEQLSTRVLDDAAMRATLGGELYAAFASARDNGTVLDKVDTTCVGGACARVGAGAGRDRLRALVLAGARRRARREARHVCFGGIWRQQ
jgi:hypothetical protein